jgi:hypothetical protein
MVNGAITDNIITTTKLITTNYKPIGLNNTFILYVSLINNVIKVSI